MKTIVWAFKCLTCKKKLRFWIFGIQICISTPIKAAGFLHVDGNMQKPSEDTSCKYAGSLSHSLFSTSPYRYPLLLGQQGNMEWEIFLTLLHMTGSIIEKSSAPTISSLCCRITARFLRVTVVCKQEQNITRNELGEITSAKAAYYPISHCQAQSIFIWSFTCKCWNWPYLSQWLKQLSTIKSIVLGAIADLSWNFHQNLLSTFRDMLLTDKQTNNVKNIIPLAKVITIYIS